MSGWKYAFSISKEDIKHATPQGTVVYIENLHDANADTESRSPVLEAVRFPTPSTDPADPLNWPFWRKVALLLVVSFYAFVANFNSSTVGPALQLWPAAFPHDPRPFKDLPYLVATNVLFLGVTNIIWVPLSNCVGRRPVLLSATLIMTLCSLWCALASSFNSLLAARIFQGVGGAAADTVAPALVGDTFFMHQRGRAMAIYTICLAAGPLVGGISGGYIAFHVGWAYIFWVSLAISGATFVGVCFFVPETLYDRETLPNLQHQAQLTASESAVSFKDQVQIQMTEYRPFTLARSLGFRKPRGHFLQSFIRPWRTLQLPGTWVVMLHYGGIVGGMVTISTIGPRLVATPPYNWRSNVGLINVGGLIGVILGAIFTYSISDAWLKRRARGRAGGYAEPEDRLPVMFPTLFIATAGFFIFGFCAQNPGAARWVGLEIGYGMVAFGSMQIPSIGFNYLIDAYSYVAADCFVMVTSLRAIVAFAWTQFVADWAEDKGPAEPFGIFGMLMGIFSLLTVPLWIFGKRTRIATSSALA